MRARSSSRTSTRRTAPSPFRLAAFEQRIYFSADDGTHGREIWRTDGSAQGTSLFKDIRPGMGGSIPCELVKLGKRLLFGAVTDDEGYEPWRSDGTNPGTRLLKDIRPGMLSSTPFGCD